MKRNQISKTLAALALVSAAFAGSAQADGARLSIGIGGYWPSARVVAFDDHRHDPRWLHLYRHHDGFGPVSAIDQRQWRQHQRIAAGIRSGELTPYEARELGREQRQIRDMERHFWHNDGRLSADEWHRLDHAQERASRHIWQERHDYQARY